MKFSDYEWLAALIAAHPDQKLIGRTRLQKEVKLLQRLGFPTSYGFNIHFYGPYSEDLQSGIGLLEEVGLVTEEEKFNQVGAPYYEFRYTGTVELPDVSGFQTAIEKMAYTDPVVLELAATYDASANWAPIMNKQWYVCAAKRGANAMKAETSRRSLY